MTIKIKEGSKKVAREEEVPTLPKDIYITFTELYTKKQVWLEEMIDKGHTLYLMPKKGAPLKITRATLI